MPRGRGGARQGTPGKGYSNRTDLGMNYGAGTAGNGGLPPVAQAAPPQPQQPTGPPSLAAYPEDSPGLLDPTARPDEPITDGLPIGPGRGDVTSMRSQSGKEIGMFKPWLPMLQQRANSGTASPTFVRLVRYLRDY